MTNSADLDAMEIQQQTNRSKLVLVVECSYVSENIIAFIRVNL